MDDARLERPHISAKRLCTESSPSRTLVSEMMIMAGQIAAEYGKCIAQKPLLSVDDTAESYRGPMSVCIA